MARTVTMICAALDVTNKDRLPDLRPVNPYGLLLFFATRFSQVVILIVENAFLFLLSAISKAVGGLRADLLDLDHRRRRRCMQCLCFLPCCPGSCQRGRLAECRAQRFHACGSLSWNVDRRRGGPGCRRRCSMQWLPLLLGDPDLHKSLLLGLIAPGIRADIPFLHLRGIGK